MRCDVSATPGGAGDGVRCGCRAEATMALISQHSQCSGSLLVGKHKARQDTVQEAGSSACSCGLLLAAAECGAAHPALVSSSIMTNTVTLITTLSSVS